MVVIFKGQESTKKVDGKDKKVIPFAGTGRDGESSSMGVGLIYPEEQSSSIWGLFMPRDIVASYRGMKIAEEVPQFGHGTLAACWYAGNRSVSFSDKKYIDDIEGMIGAENRQRIIQAPLPSFDDAVRLMQEKGIDFDAYPFLTEIEQGNLSMTPVLEQAVNDYSDRVLLFRGGLAGDFGKAYQALTEEPKGLLARFKKRKVGSEHIDSARAYVAMVEQMLPSFIPDVERQSGLLDQKIEGTVLGVSQFSEHSRESVEPARTKIYDGKARFDEATAKLRQTTASQMPPKEKFITYHTALKAMVRAASNISSGFSTLEIYAGKEEPLRNVFRASISLAKETVKVINSTVRRNMQGAYALKY